MKPQPTAPAATPPGTAGRHQRTAPESWNLDSLPPELDYFRSSEAYQVELTGFQGPMDLLLHLIDREQVDIYDIPIARITDQFIRHIEVMQTISLDKAGEFIAMAATLLVIKMKMLMPSHSDEEEEDQEDPRAELVRKLLEYHRFKEAAESLQKQESDRRQYHLRQTRFPSPATWISNPSCASRCSTCSRPWPGFSTACRPRPVHDVVREAFTVEEKMSLIEEKIGSGGHGPFRGTFQRGHHQDGGHRHLHRHPGDGQAGPPGIHADRTDGTHLDPAAGRRRGVSATRWN